MANLHELSAQCLIQNGNFQLAIDTLSTARQVLRESGTLDLLYVDKWIATAHLALSNESSMLEKVRAESMKLGQWENVRGCYLNPFLFKPSHDLFVMLYGGTPFESFRRSLVKLNLSYATPDLIEIGMDCAPSIGQLATRV